MLLNNITKYASNSKFKNILALKISAYAFLLITVSFALLISINHFRSISDERANFEFEILLMKQSENFPENIIQPHLNNHMNLEDRIKINELHDYLIISDDGGYSSNGLFQIIKEQGIIKDINFDIGYISFGDKTYIVSFTKIPNKKVYLAKDISFIVEGEKEMILTAIILDILIFILMYFLSQRLSLIVIEPIEKANKRLKDYNHNLAHELKTPISIVKSDLELSRMSSEPLDYNQTIAELKHIEDIVNSLLMLSEVGGDKNKNEVSVSQLIKKNIETLKKIYKDRGIRIETVITKEIRINTNVKLLEIFIKNIIENAYKYAVSKSVVNIMINGKMLSISNKGSGLKAEDVENLFQPFFKGSNSVSGYGLGLNIVKTIAEQNGWKIKARIHDDIYSIIINF